SRARRSREPRTREGAGQGARAGRTRASDARSRAASAGSRQDRAALDEDRARGEEASGQKMTTSGRVAVLGAGGFIGSHLVPALLRRLGCEIDAVDFDFDK